ncbi:hypothetical protein C7H19_00560 [Aphanothece hegewaldii CCALA 016]|uniref:Uncharacterized protein n=1 Tax=Aphanothece hegewaldii CCALA 016 TaxID=2107694 RepID=A0A2T1M395_9CHRO|nr:hypothetical protein [Aphanothece hegewaldii]PSF39314.1 hypothetical protein C7H19_00560 [Aphanothece hegewaldii CCALA 016]
MRRRSRKNNLPTQNLDSFLDILTNTVGVLMFVSLFITLITVQTGAIVKTPLVKKSQKQPHFFEINHNRVAYIDDKLVNSQLSQVLENLPSCNEPKPPSAIDESSYQDYLFQLQEYESCRQIMVEQIKSFQTETKFYQVRFVGQDSLLYVPKSEKIGDSMDELKQKDSNFTNLLKSMNPQTEYLAFIVRPDSFATFRAARKQAWDKGFDVGWEPHPQESPIVFGSSGRAIGVQ